jgi:membrane protease YdiL (CAAX protease family)
VAGLFALALVLLYQAGAYLFFGMLGQPRLGLLLVGPVLVLLPLLGTLRAASLPIAETLGLVRTRKRTLLLAVVAMIAAVPPVLAAAVRITPPSEREEAFFTDLLSVGSAGDILLLLLGAALIPATVEELLFRGLLQRSAEARLGRWPGILLAAAAFGVIHGPGRGLSAFLLGAVLGWIRSRTGSVIPAIIAHASVNAMAISVVNTNGFGQGDGWPETLPWPALSIWAVVSVVALSAMAWTAGKRPSTPESASPD